MRLVIEQSEFRRLSPETQRELIETLAGRTIGAAEPPKKAPDALWRRPMDLTPEMAVRLIHGLSQPHRVRLRLFAEKGGRVSQKDLLAATKDTEMRVLSHFQAVLTRRLRRFVDDPDRKIHLIGWDFGATEWDKSHAKIVDGVYYVTEATTGALRECFGLEKGGTRARA